MCQILFTSFTKEKYLDKYLKKYFAKLCQPHYWCSICLAPPPSLCVGIPTWHCRYQQFIIVHHWILVHKYQYLRERTEHQRTWTTNTGLQGCCRGSPRSQEAAPCSTKLGCGECPSRPRHRGVVVARVRQSAHRGNSRCAVLGPVTCHTQHTRPAPVRSCCCPRQPGPHQPDDNKDGRPDRAARDQVRAEPRWFPQQCRVQQPSTTATTTTAVGHSQQLSTMGELNKSHFLRAPNSFTS